MGEKPVSHQNLPLDWNDIDHKRYELLIEKQASGNKLSMEEIHTLMLYALELLRYFGDQTQAGIDRANELARRARMNAGDLKCRGKIPVGRGHPRKPCDRPVDFLVGSAKVPYCRLCAKNFPKFVERIEVFR